MDESTASFSPRSGDWCPEFRPTSEEFASFAKYIRTQVEPQCASVGICKIIPPEGWFTRSYAVEDLASCLVSKPVSQHVAGKKGVFNVDLVERKTMSISEFQKLARTLGHEEPASDLAPDDVERLFWKSLRPTMDAPVYGADIVNSLFGDAEAMSWNLNRLDTILRRIDLPGVTRSMLYFGMWRAMFAFHTEDMDLYSINYVHTGKPKFWYAVPPSAAAQLERVAQSLFPEKHHACSQFMRHKTSMMSPSRLKEFGVPYYKAFQRPGEFVITFPATYHQGFNLGFNIAEAVNFASLRWIPFGLKAKVCKCVHDSVSIDMDVFLTKVFETREADPDLLGDDAWIFSCQCGKFASSEEPSFVVDEPWFECSECQIWAHVRCVHPALAVLKEEELPPSMLCHRCKEDENHLAIAALKSPMQEDLVPKKGSVLGKRKEKELSTPTKAIPRLTPQSTPKSRSPCASVEPEKKREGLGRKMSARKSLFVKGTTIQFQDAEARVAAVEGKFIRVHYKGQSAHEDEWLPVDSEALQQRILAVSPPPRIRKLSARAEHAALEVSVGEFDAHTGFTYITLQRGRLMFNMGPPSTKRAAAAAAEETTKDASASSLSEHAEQTHATTDNFAHRTTVLPRPPPREQQRVFRSGVFTGRSLYAEEAVFLAQRGALVVFEMEEVTAAEDVRIPTSDPRQPLSLAQITALVVRLRFATLAAIDVYAFLKCNKLHPRRHAAKRQLPETEETSDHAVHNDEHQSPRLFFFDVFKSITETQFISVGPPPPPLQEREGVPVVASTVKMQKRKIKRLALIFRVGVSSFQDVVPRPRELLRLIDVWTQDTSREHTEAEKVPLKLAVADADRSVLLFEVA